MQTQSFVRPLHRIIAGAISLTAALSCQGQVISGDVTPAPWDVDTDVYIGQSAQGSVQIDSGAVVESKEAFIGGASNGVGEVSVSGSGSVWNVVFLQAGAEGTGTLTIENGGRVSSSWGASLGAESGSSGTVTVRGVGSRLELEGQLEVGYSGSGTLNVQNGGKVVVEGSYTTLGGYRDSSGAVIVSGAGSELNVQGLYVASEGSGTLSIEDGGKVLASSTVSIGEYASAQGAIVVTGEGSELVMERLYVGQRADATLTIEDGALTQVDGLESYNVHIGSASFIQLAGGFFAWQGDHFDTLLQLILGGNFQYWNGTEYVSLAAGENYLDYFTLEYVANVADSAAFGGNATLAGLDGYTILTAVPEPGTYAAILSVLAAGAALYMKRRNRAL